MSFNQSDIPHPVQDMLDEIAAKDVKIAELEKRIREREGKICMKIKFSHHYLKMPTGFENSRLLDVLRVRLEDLSKPFLDYDTCFDDGQGLDNYPLPKRGDYMILLLHVEGEATLWTTIRRWTPAKEAYYRKNIGQVFRCVIE